MTIEDILQKKKTGQKMAMLTAYDYPTAMLMDECGMDIILVGDSLANVVLGLQTTAQVGMPEMLHHCKAVTRAVKNALVVGDMPFRAYQVKSDDAVANAKRLMDEGGCGAVKLEWFDHCVLVTKTIVNAGIPVMGHVGLTPQTVDPNVGMKVQGKDVVSAKRIMEQAKILQDTGCFAIVLECVPQELAATITQQLTIPTFGIGAGKYCDGQVLVSHDLLGLSLKFSPKFSKKYTDLSLLMKEAFSKYKQEVTSGVFPDDAHSFHMPADELKNFL